MNCHSYRARHIEHAGKTEGSEAVGGSSCGSQLSPGGCSTEMISDGCTDANGMVLVRALVSWWNRHLVAPQATMDGLTAAEVMGEGWYIDLYRRRSTRFSETGSVA